MPNEVNENKTEVEVTTTHEVETLDEKAFQEAELELESDKERTALARS